jgi:D-amino-acid dehydrogenase
VDGRRLASTLLRAAAGTGARRLSAGVTALSRRDGRVVGVETTAGSISCGAVVIAGGAWSKEFGNELGVDLPVGPMKGQIVHLQLPAPVDSSSWPIVQPVLNYYLVPWPDGRVACGGTMEAGAGFDTRPTVTGVQQLLRAALSLAPGLAEAALVEVRVGLRPTSVDDLPIVGVVPGWSNAFVATGHGAEGLLLGPYSGRLVTALIAGGLDASATQPAVSAADATIELAHFSPSRFTP